MSLEKLKKPNVIHPGEQARELDDAEVFLSRFGVALPAAITAELEETRRRLLS